jgi:hypothetical protein
MVVVVLVVLVVLVRVDVDPRADLEIFDMEKVSIMTPKKARSELASLG